MVRIRRKVFLRSLKMVRTLRIWLLSGWESKALWEWSLDLYSCCGRISMETVRCREYCYWPLYGDNTFLHAQSITKLMVRGCCHLLLRDLERWSPLISLCNESVRSHDTSRERSYNFCVCLVGPIIFVVPPFSNFTATLWSRSAIQVVGIQNEVAKGWFALANPE